MKNERVFEKFISEFVRLNVAYVPPSDWFRGLREKCNVFREILRSQEWIIITYYLLLLWRSKNPEGMLVRENDISIGISQKAEDLSFQRSHTWIECTSLRRFWFTFYVSRSESIWAPWEPNCYIYATSNFVCVKLESKLWTRWWKIMEKLWVKVTPNLDFYREGLLLLEIEVRNIVR